MTIRGRMIARLVGLVVLFGAPGAAFAHCDTLDGPVITAARQALDTGNVDLVSIWVQPKDEAEIRAAFQKTRAVRQLDPAAKELADHFFFETLVRVHRQGEGAPYTGLKPAAGEDLGPAIPAADQALETGTPDAVEALLTDAVRAGLREKFSAVLSKKDFKKDDVAAGRAYVEAYVQYMHYVERIYQNAAGPVHGHHSESEAAPEQGHEAPAHKD